MLYTVTLITTVCAFVLLLLVNLGTTFDSSFLPKIYLIKVNESVTHHYITYGIYDSCLYNNTQDAQTLVSCTPKAPGYSFDARQFAELCGANMDDETSIKIYTDILDRINLKIFQTAVLILPALIFAVIALVCTLILRQYRQNTLTPWIGAFSSLLGFFSGAAGLALIMATFWKGLDLLEQRIEGLSHQWGPSIYLTGMGLACLILSLVCFLLRLCTHQRKSGSTHSRDTLQLYDYDRSQRHHQQQAAADAYSPWTALDSSSPTRMLDPSPTAQGTSPPPMKQRDSGYDYVHAITTSPMESQQPYPSYPPYQDPYRQHPPSPPHAYYQPPPTGNYF
ncbi:hypothetical protein BDF20DRAFT_883242 [Mycotypha africana]|uniref:uncharacterized protein n=1 Tax=Mycotypha africana TaxID=64632 RepID=UPI0023010770|nr:uncharacterized protein BDF20DRAFT_883242 [Mycotypha africana]KAI8973607.1 hypothetical protein BDF20DRAFT_883242 [Mycotypha africana]